MNALALPVVALLLAGLGLTAPAAASTACPDTLDVTVRTLVGKETVRLCDQYAGKVILVVNTASYCGFTPQYDGLEKLYREYRDRGFVVLGFPSNDFEQEPGNDQQIADFCRLTYGVEFPMFEKVRVVGENAHLLYRNLGQASGQFPRWNFHKYLISRDGKVVGSFSSTVTPESTKLVRAIESQL
jgi:glutathione peroxidase